MEGKPLEGVKVLEVAMWVFGPTAAAVLGEMGAEVIKIEHPLYGDPQRGLRNQELSRIGRNPWVHIANRGKRSVGLDIGTDLGRETLGRLIKWADVFITSMLPEARRKMRIEVEDIRADNPNIIVARASGLGQRGPERERGGYDLATGWGRGGTAFKLTADEGEPPMMPASFYDLSGSISLAGGIAMALFKRERTGTPSVVDTALLNVGMWPLAPDIVMAPALGELKLARDRSRPGNPTVNWYRTKDNRWLYLVHLQADRWWPDLCQRLGHPELISDPRFETMLLRAENQEECVRILDEIFATRTLAEWAEVLNESEGVWGPVQSPAELYSDPQVIANGWLPDVVATDGDKLQVVAPPFQFDEQLPAVAGPAPEAGQHTEEVLLELGLTWDDITVGKESGAFQ